MLDRLRRWLSLWTALCCLAAGSVFPSPAFAAADGRRAERALLIGVDDFVSQPSTYPSSTNNVFAMQEALQSGSAPFDAIMIPSGPVTDTDCLANLIRDTFADADGDDVSYLYISTHGEYDPENGVEPALLLSDGVTEGRVTPQALEAAFQGIAGTKVILLDACYSGAFIGKGMRTQPDTLSFLGDDFKVLTSSGAMEESWYWNAAREVGESNNADYGQGAFYFTQMLSQSINPRYGAPADANRDGKITLTELYDSLLENHAASTPQVYPQEDDFVVFTYNLSERETMNLSDRSPIGDVTFSGSTLSSADNELTLEFIALRPVRVAYQVVYRRGGKWRFDEAQLLYDNVERYTAYGDEEGAVSPGRKLRTLTLSLPEGDESGYVIVQLVSIENGKLTVHAGRVIAVPPGDGDPALAVEVSGAYTLGSSREMAIFVGHTCPCELSVSIVNEAGETIRKLCHRQSTRPLKICGSTFYWSGRDQSGALVAPGVYHIRVTSYLGNRTFSAESGAVTVRPSDS